MKNKFIVIVVMFLACSAAFAQHRVGGITIQPKLGLVVSELTKSGSDDRLGLTTGAEVEFQLTNMFSLSAGALYSMQGSENTDLDYINLPVLANIYVVRGLAVKMGLQPGININDDGLDAKTLVLSLPIGVSYELKNFVFETRYNLGISKVIDNWKGKNNVFQLTFGYKFDL